MKLTLLPSIINKLPDTSRAILYVVFASFWFGVMACSVRFLADEGVPLGSIAFWRNLFSVMLLLPWVYKVGVSGLRTQHFPLHFLRAIFGTMMMLSWYYVLSTLSLPLAVSISFTCPLFTVIFAFFLLKERVGLHRISAILVGFCGMLIIIRPGFEDITLPMMLALLVASGWAVTGIIIKILTRYDEPHLILLSSVALMVPLTAPLLIVLPYLPSFFEFCLLIGVALSANAAQLYVSRSFQLAPVVLVIPFDFTRLLFTSIFAYLAFGELLDVWTFIGAGIIIAASVYIALRESKKSLQKEQVVEFS